MEITLSTQPQEQQAQEWNGAVEALLPSTPAAAAWPHLASFCALHRYLSGVDVCERVAGEDGSPGCVRYVASHPAGEEGQEQEQLQVKWAHEELLELDDAARRLSYAVVGGNMGFGRYVATMTVAEETEAAGCRIVWEFECEPVQGWSRDGLVGYLDGAVKGMAARIEEAATADES
ncbi:lachrymatory-factor synthase-like [Lolium rigidum]|uniref:lachrymatory-factor synthase-like n=1 Tax=Lolium rigidum TaxID=89674 RepID=UPI001F5CDB7C|nr:lachrymatory-factor synthase-like [Lolium rigidum]